MRAIHTFFAFATTSGLWACGTTHTTNITVQTPRDLDARATPIDVAVVADAPAHCRVATDAGTGAALSDDGARMAAIVGGRLAIVDTRSCRTIRSYTYTSRGAVDPTIYAGRATYVAPVRDAGVRALAFAGTTHDVVLLRDQSLDRIGADGTVRSAAFGYRVQRWAIAPDGERIVLAFDRALAVFDGALVEQRRIRLRDEEDVDGMAFIPATGRLVVTQPTGSARLAHVTHLTHLATELDLGTYRIERRQRLAGGQPQRTLVATDGGRTLVWGSLRFDRDGALTHLEDHAWQTSAGGTVAVASDDRGYFVWNVDGRRDIRRLLPDRDRRDLATHSLSGVAAYAAPTIATPAQVPVGVGSDGSVLLCGNAMCDVVTSTPEAISVSATTAVSRSARLAPRP
ncbi:MAG: hypothetical protein KF773_18080 [Deltaproteobacteria bacterium]|nr:hypothetical protein [Deltaproteobacteria bacterium]